MNQNIQNEKNTIEIQLVRPTEVCGKVLSVENVNKSVKTALLLSNVIGADQENSCLFRNKGHFSSPLWVLFLILCCMLYPFKQIMQLTL